MRTSIRMGVSGVLGAFALVIAATGLVPAGPIVHSGVVVAVNEATGTIVVGDMGPRLATGRSEITRRTVRVTPSTEFDRVERAAGTAPSGWIGGYESTRAPAWDVRAGDWVTVAVEQGATGAIAVRVTVVHTSER